MPVPKRKVSKSRRDKRQSTKFIRAQAFTLCANCESAISPHQACLKCGFYKGRKIMAGKLDKSIKRAERIQAQQQQVAQAQQEEQGNE